MEETKEVKEEVQPPAKSEQLEVDKAPQPEFEFLKPQLLKRSILKRTTPVIKETIKEKQVRFDPPQRADEFHRYYNNQSIPFYNSQEYWNSQMEMADFSIDHLPFMQNCIDYSNQFGPYRAGRYDQWSRPPLNYNNPYFHYRGHPYNKRGRYDHRSRQRPRNGSNQGQQKKNNKRGKQSGRGHNSSNKRHNNQGNKRKLQPWERQVPDIRGFILLPPEFHKYY